MFNAGTASEVITPAEPLWLAGYASRTTPARGRISDLHATALALDDAQGNRLAIASIDLIAITPIISDRVHAEVKRQMGLERSQLVLAASHTHYGPEFRQDKALFFKIPPEYGAKLESVAIHVADTISRLIKKACENLEPVRLFARRTQAGFAHNRRRTGVKFGAPSTEDVLDQDVPILEVIRTDGSRSAILFGYACHNTTLPPEDCRYCADWAGFAKHELQRANPGTAALFVAGCGADQNPEPRGTLELSQQFGREIAGEIQAVIDGGEAIEITSPIRTLREDVRLPLQPVTRQKLDEMVASADPPQRVKARFLLDQLDRGEALITEYSAPVQAVSIGGSFLMILLSGEPVVDWAIKFKREFADPTKLVWVAGYCNDMFGYLPTRRIQQEGGYEGGRANLWSWIPTPFTEEIEDLITDAVRRLVARVST